MTRWAPTGLSVPAILSAGCAGLPSGTYSPAGNDPNAIRVANALHRAAVAVGDDPARYTFALIKTGSFVPGVGLLDFMVNPLVVRAFSRKQELQADQRAVEILRDMGDATPRRSLADALRAVDDAPVRSQAGERGVLDVHPSLKERLGALEPLQPLPLAEAVPKP